VQENVGLRKKIIQRKELMYIGVFLSFAIFQMDMSGVSNNEHGGFNQWTRANSDPPGYTQASIATIRLWKRR